LALLLIHAAALFHCCAVQNRLDDEDMSPECKAEVVRDQNRMAQDYRLNWRLKTACKADIGQLCDGLCNDKEGQMCGGVVLQCLQVRGLAQGIHCWVVLTYSHVLCMCYV
jgi:hypothetical protein